MIDKEREKADKGKYYLLKAVCTRRISSKNNITLATTTAIRYVRQGIVEEFPLKRGVPGELSKDDMKILAGAFGIFVEIKQANEDKDKASRKIWLVL